MEKYMYEAIELAKKGIGRVNPNPLVGALIVKEGKIVGRGYHREYGGKHAEVFALEEAGELANGAILYVTLEPCSHYGKTPPCTKLIIKKSIKKVIIGIVDPNPFVSGRGIDELRNSGIEVEVGMCKKEIIKLNRVFLHYIKKNEPLFYLKTAICLDGYIATHNGSSKWISNTSARAYVQNLRNEFMAILVGVETINIDNSSLLTNVKNGRNPIRIVLDPYLRININSNFIKYGQKDNKSFLITSEKEREKSRSLEKFGINFIYLSNREFSVFHIKRELYKLGIDSVLVEGGRRVISTFLKEGGIDMGSIFIAPKILGDKRSISIVEGRKIDNLNEGIDFTNVKYEIFGDNIFMHFGGIKCLQD